MKNKNRVICMIIIFILVIGTTFSAKEPKDYELVITHVNDVHGRVVEGKYDGVGYARIDQINKNLKDDKLNKNVIMVDAGDSFHGTTFATLEKGESIVKILNKLGLKAATLGNHDFNYGSERTKELKALSNYKILATNVKYKKTGENFTTKYIIEEIEGIKVGIFGLSTPETLYKTNPKNVEDLEFLEPITVARETVKELQENGVKFIIVLTHLGDDLSTKEEWRSTTLAEKVEGINLIIDGHSHTQREKKEVINGTVLVQTGEYGKNVGVLKIDFDSLKDGSDAIEYKLLKKDEIMGKKNKKGEFVGGIIQSKRISSLIDEIKLKQNKITEVIIGNTDVLLVGEREFVRSSETNLSNLINDSMIWKSKADLSITNGGGIRASIKEGDITVGDIITTLPFGNYVVTKELTGKDIKVALEHGFKDLPNSAGSLAQIGGITLELDLTKSQGNRVSNIKFKNGKKFDLNATYIVATNDFMAVGGDGYSSFKGRKEVANFLGLDEILIEYIKTGKKIPKKEEGRVKIKK